ncbi:phosphoserine phosphatase SerB [Pseudarthrobacter sp. J1738]|uniref:phosphoserine phosphatase SerB n=1 Tax=Pseudarthrobacter sp. J1738 TaxID=3420446 RepID=UPI003D27490F
MPSVLTALVYGPSVSPADIDQIQAVLMASGATVEPEKHQRTEFFDLVSMELKHPQDEATALAALRSAVAPSVTGDVDVALVANTLRQSERKLLIMDVDSTLIQQEVIELIAAYAGKREEVAAVTEAAMRGELDFAESLRARVAVLAGLPESVLDQVRHEVVLSRGARSLVEAFHQAGHVVALVSGGFSQILAPIAADLGITNYLANDLEIVDSQLTGQVSGAIVDRATKARMLREYSIAAGIAAENTIAVGDGANDLDMLAAAGLGVAFNAKPAVRAAADAAINIPDLDVVRYLAGV